MGRVRYSGPVKSTGGFEIGAAADGFTAETNTTAIDEDGYLYQVGTKVTATAAELNLNDLSAVGAMLKVKKISVTASDGTEQDSGWDLPDKAVVLDVFVDVTTAESTGSTKTLDVGLLSSESGGDANGFLDGVSTASTGLVRGVPTITTGSNEVYFASTTRGVLLASLTAGSDAATDVGTYYEKPHLSDSVTAKSVSYTAGSAQTEFVGAIFVVYIEIA